MVNLIVTKGVTSYTLIAVCLYISCESSFSDVIRFLLSSEYLCQITHPQMMSNPFKTIWSFLAYWYFRYTLVTELYMVEPWERRTCNILIILVLIALSVFNSKVILRCSAALFFPDTLNNQI